MIKSSAKAFLRNALATALILSTAGPAPAQVPGLVNQGGSDPGLMFAPPAGGVPGLVPGMAGQPTGSSGFPVPSQPIGGPSYGLPPGMPVPAGMKMAPQFDPNMWKNASAGRLNAGTVLSGILEDEISSDGSKAGDVFSVRLEDGYVVNGVEILPKHTKIIGSVVAVVSARFQRNGSAGKINISLQTLVLPDGRNTKFYGFVDRNPNLHLKNKPGTDIPGKSIPGYTARGLVGVLNVPLSRIGRAVQVPNIGTEFKIPKGELLPVRLSRTLDLSQLSPPPIGVAGSNAPPAQNAPPPGPPAGGSAPAPGHMPLPPGQMPNFSPNAGMTGPAGPIGVPVNSASPHMQTDLPDPF